MSDSSERLQGKVPLSLPPLQLRQLLANHPNRILAMPESTGRSTIRCWEYQRPTLMTIRRIRAGWPGREERTFRRKVTRVGCGESFQVLMTCGMKKPP